MMRSKGSYLPVDNAFPFEGLDTNTPSTQLPPGASPNNLNMNTFRGTLIKRSGSVQLGNTISGGESIIRLCSFQRSDGVMFLLAFTPTRVFYLLSSTWTEITPHGKIASFTTSGSNGWSVGSGSFNVGDFVSQANTLAKGQWMAASGGSYNILVTYGIFDASSTITSTSGATLVVTGTDPNRVSTTVAKFPQLGTGTNGWSATVGSFDPGSTVAQVNSGATGVWYSPSSGNFRVEVTSGTFDETDDIQVTSLGGLGTLSLTGGVPATINGSGYAVFPKLSGGNGWSIANGAFTVGDTVSQAISGAVGTWVAPDGSNYYVQPVSGVFDNVDPLTDQTQWGGLSFGGVSPAASTATVYVAPTSTGKVLQNGNAQTFVDVCEDFVDENLGRILVATNGVDPPFYWDGVAANASFVPIDIDVFCCAACVATFTGYLVFGNITTLTDVEPRTVVWSDVGNCLSWNTGSSGTLAEIGMEGKIHRLLPFAGALIVFTSKGIGSITYINDQIIFGFQTNVAGITVAGPRAITSVNPFIVFVSQDNVYIWDGGRAISPMGDKIATLWRSIQVDLYVKLTQLFHDITKNQIRFIIFTSDSTFEVLVLEIAVTSMTFYDIQKSNHTRWFQHSYGAFPACFAHQFLHDQGTGMVVMGSTSGEVFVEQGQPDDAGVAVTQTWDTGDFVVPQLFQSQNARWLELEFEASGTSVDVSFSTDKGANFQKVETVPLTATPQPLKVYFDTTSRFLRIRFSSNVVGGSFSLSWYRVWCRPGGAR